MIEKLFPHQETGKDYLLANRHSCLFWEVGTGKTNTVIAAVNSLPRGKLLILSPAYVMRHMWEKYSDLPINHDVDLKSYEYLSRHREFYKTNRYDYIICDECHKLKSRKSNIARVVKNLTKPHNCKYAWGLTGTPYATSFLDVWGIFNALNINEFKESYDSFMHTFYDCKVVCMVFGKFIYQPDKLKPGALDILVRRIGDHASVLRSKDCLELPELTVKEIKIPGMVTKQFIDATKGIITYADDHQETVNKLACIQKLHQLSNGFVYDATKKAVVFKENIKLKDCEDLILSELEEREKLILVFLYQYDYECLVKMLDNAKISHTDKFDEFCSKQVLLLQEQKAIGVNLQEFTSCIILYTFNFSYLDYTQTVGRVYRSGQKSNCTVYALINAGTYEVKIWQSVKNNYNVDTLFKELMVGLGDIND